MSLQSLLIKGTFSILALSVSAIVSEGTLRMTMIRKRLLTVGTFFRSYLKLVP